VKSKTDPSVDDRRRKNQRKFKKTTLRMGKLQTLI
jgi:hypothetical protein